MIKRRDFIAVLGGAAVAWPIAARAQQPDAGDRVSRQHNSQQWAPFMAAFLEGLGEADLSRDGM